MINLTEQWKKGELLDGTYYVKLNWDNIITTLFYSLANGFENNDRFYDEDEIKQVLAPVPSYQEYLALESDSLAKIEGDEINAELEARLKKTQELELELRKENALLKEYEKECHRADELEDSYWKAEKENTKLKELLKECRPYIGYDTYEFDEKVNKLLTKIEEALK